MPAPPPPDPVGRTAPLLAGSLRAASLWHYSSSLARLESVNNLFQAVPVLTSLCPEGPSSRLTRWGQHPLRPTRPASSLGPRSSLFSWFGGSRRSVSSAPSTITSNELASGSWVIGDLKAERWGEPWEETFWERLRAEKSVWEAGQRGPRGGTSPTRCGGLVRGSEESQGKLLPWWAGPRQTGGSHPRETTVTQPLFFLFYKMWIIETTCRVIARVRSICSVLS